jgi:hypothetical protein
MLNSMLRPGILQVAALGNVMSFRSIAMIYTAGTALALATPAAAEELSADGASYAPVYAPANDMPSAVAPDIRPEWRGGATNVALLPDSRTRDTWLHECRQRTAYYYDNGGNYRHYRRHDRDRAPDYGYAPGYDYCEAYAYPAMVRMRPVAVAQSYQTNAPRVEEVVTEHYEPIRSRTIPSRRIRPAMHDKRVRVSP